ncbi:RNA recognition motif domain-containing protein [Flavobacterium sp.]|jgi:RNA recognition motif-containing protein|uniref:RNA recognition motif domain-containing protein n=1 Tax=Flavobacterium sp. TaxID=239 RepID=UPI0022C1209A|nr:RNA-binding protein [Flavobacterium sp.]MCZ8145665.1 RNA-binding protein [Flavobacterium sp.]MCZ8168090.1 RNA-binding protein [Flavobacterium sp.]MCZ8297438.1 RNA-binding protein [Flavobacterium sp.]MCZ8367282.1 RNA-binding protein [Flavobacterium sp.]
MNIYVSNLSYHTSESDLRELFSAYGEVNSTKIITDRETGRPRGFAFVEMAQKEEGQRAIQGLNNTSVDNFDINVAEARPREERPQSRNSFQSYKRY